MIRRPSCRRVSGSRAAPSVARRWLILAAVIMAGAATAPAAVATPVAITSGPDGNLWFTVRDALDPNGNRVGSIAADGRVREYWQGLRQWSWTESAITTGPDRNLWFTDADAVGRLSPDGRVSYFSRGIRRRTWLSSIAAGPDGNLWLTDRGPRRRWGGRIARMTPTGHITWFRTPVGYPAPESITVGPDGNHWFTAPGDGLFAPFASDWWEVPPPSGRIGRITPTGRITNFSEGIGRRGWPSSITAGPDGNVWFTQPYRDGIGRITPDGVITRFRKGIHRCARPGDITAGPDGNLWFTLPDRNALGRITPDGVVTELPDPVRVERARRVGLRGIEVRVRCCSCRGIVRLLSVRGAGGRPSDVVGMRRFSAGAGRAVRVLVPLSPDGRRLLGARGRLEVIPRVQTEPGLLLGSQDSWARGNFFVLREPAAIRGRAVSLRVTPTIRRALRVTHVAGRSPWERTRIRGPIAGTTYRARLNRGEWAMATFWNPNTGFTDATVVFNRPIGGSWRQVGDTWNPCESELPRSVLAVWGLDRCESPRP